MTTVLRAGSRSWFFWTLATACGIVNVGLLVEMLSTLTMKSNLAQLEMGLLLTFVIFGLPVVIVSLLMIVYLLRRRASAAEAASVADSFKLKISLVGVNLAIPIVFLLFFLSVKAYGYYWV